MKGFLNTGLRLLMIALVIIGAGSMIYYGSFSDQGNAFAATDNPSPASPGYQIITIGPFSQTSTAVAGLWTIKAPWPFRVVGFAGRSGAMSNTVSFDLKNASGVSLLSSQLTPTTTAAVATDATLTTNSAVLNITDETTLQIDSVTGGTGTTTNTTLQLEIKRL